MSDRLEHLRTPSSYRDTSVSISRSQTAIEHILSQFGCDATSFTIARRADDAVASVRFGYAARIYRIAISLGASPAEQRQNMRVLYWYIKATLEAVAFGILSAEEALLPYAEIGDGHGGVTTVGRAALPMMGQAELPSADALYEALVPMKALPKRGAQG